MTFIEIIGDILERHKTKVGNQCPKDCLKQINFSFWFSSDSFMYKNSTLEGSHYVFWLSFPCYPFSSSLFTAYRRLQSSLMYLLT